MIRSTGFDFGKYADYLAWQGRKSLDPKWRELFTVNRKARVEWFRSRFQSLAVSGNALCLGARYGEEVEALRDLGWDAKGIDVNPWPPFVEAGDMNHHAGMFDLVFTNSLDHCWEPVEFLANVAASLNAGGKFLLHLSDGQPGEWETWCWDYLSDVLLTVERSGLRIERIERFPAFYDLNIEVLAVRP